MSEKITLTVIQGSLKGKEYVFENNAWCVIGRAEDCDIRLPRDFGQMDVSRHHCLLEIDPPSIRVRDLGSLHGTYVNGETIGQRPRDQLPEDVNPGSCPAHDLNSGDELRVGNTVFRVNISVSADALQPTYFL
jgi:eukaryotic-like serine/threonine-protein kinase